MKRLIPLISILLLSLNVIKISAAYIDSHLESNDSQQINWQFAYENLIGNTTKNYFKKIGWKFGANTLSSFIIALAHDQIPKKVSLFPKDGWFENHNLRVPVVLIIFVIISYSLAHSAGRFKDKCNLAKKLEFLSKNVGNFPSEIQEDILKIEELSKSNNKISEKNLQILSLITQKVHQHFKENPNRLNVLKISGELFTSIAGMLTGMIINEKLLTL